MASEDTKVVATVTESESVVPASARGLAVAILAEAERRRAYVDLLLRAELRKSGLGRRDKSLVSELDRGAVRWRRYLRWVLKKRYHGDYLRAPLKLKAILEVATYELFFHPSTPGYAIVSEAVDLARREGGSGWAARANAVLRKLEPVRGNRPLPADTRTARGLSIATSHPEWLVKRWLSQFGYETARALLEANNRPAPLFVRVNTARFTAAEVRDRLSSLGVDVQEVPLFPNFLRIERLPSALEDLELFRAGALAAQDPSATLPVALLDLRPGDTVWDLCAAPGGKATAAAEQLEGQGGRVFAADLQLHRVRLVRDAARRLGLSSIHPLCADARTPPFRRTTKVLVDAPCSGTGVLRRRVDARWQRTEDDIPKLKKLQLEILAAVAKVVTPGGVLVYSTCTLERDEDEEVVEEFLSRHSDFQLDPAHKYVAAEFVTDTGAVRTFPHVHDLDGTFAVRLVRIK